MIDIYHDDTDESGPRIWAIGGGKGGVGKSGLAANLGVVLAKGRERVGVVDADLGGANLHTIFGMPDPKVTLSDYLDKKVAKLDDIVLDTSVPGLHLVSGAHALLEMANPNYGQKGKVLRHVAALDVDHVILDLGAGSAFNVLDFFLVARRGILVVVPEATSIENAHHFLKAAFFRKLKMAQPRKQVRAAIAKVVTGSSAREVRTPKNLISKIMTVDPEVGATLVAEASTFSPSLIVNRVEHPEHYRLGEDMGAACRDYFGIRLECLATFPSDRLLVRSVAERQPIVDLFPQSRFAVAVKGVAERLALPTWSTA